MDFDKAAEIASIIYPMVIARKGMRARICAKKKCRKCPIYELCEPHLRRSAKEQPPHLARECRKANEGGRKLLLLIIQSLNRKKMEEKSRLKTMVDAIRDKNLYGRGFLYHSVYYLAFGLFVQCLIHFLLNPQLLIIYVPLYIGLILITAIFTKNLLEFHPMPPILAYLFLSTSALSKAFAYVAPFPNVYPFFPPDAQRFAVIFVSEGALLASLVTIVVLGQRISLRNSVGLTDKFFDKEKDRWKSEVNEFPNFDMILESLNDGRFVPGLFDEGFFNLTILWSCNVMEKVVDTIIEGIVSKVPEKEVLFKTEEGRRQRYSLKLKKLDYKFILNHQKDNTFNVNILWHEVRNDIAHRNYKPTFYETNETLKILISFVRETPTILRKWSST
jgi:hypothetical protein